MAKCWRDAVKFYFTTINAEHIFSAEQWFYIDRNLLLCSLIWPLKLFLLLSSRELFKSYTQKVTLDWINLYYWDRIRWRIEEVKPVIRFFFSFNFLSEKTSLNFLILLCVRTTRHCKEMSIDDRSCYHFLSIEVWRHVILLVEFQIPTVETKARSSKLMTSSANTYSCVTFDE